MVDKRRLVIIITVLAVLTAGAFTALAYQENNLDSPCEHSYVLSSFSSNTASFTCQNCGASESIVFADHIGQTSNDSNFESLLDRNDDGIINGRDLAYLKHNS